MFPTSINRNGVVAGEVEPNGPGDRYAFVFQNRRLQNVNALVSSPAVYFRHVVALTDNGVLAVQGGELPAQGSGGVFASFLSDPAASIATARDLLLERRHRHRRVVGRPWFVRVHRRGR